MSPYDLALFEALDLAKSARPVAEILHDRWLYVCDDLPALAFVASESATIEQKTFAIIEQFAIAQVQHAAAIASQSLQSLQDLPAAGDIQ
jgi:hypothetical protein